MSLTAFTRPAKILPGLYISGVTAAKAAAAAVSGDRLPTFRGILSLGHDEVILNSPKSPLIVHKQIPLSVLPAQNLLVKLDEACSFIRYSLRRDDGGSVLIHCLDGLNLAPSIAIAYLMQAKCLDYDAALAVVRRKRPHARPAPHFEDQLRIWHNIDHCIHDPRGNQKLPYVLWAESMKDIFKTQQRELKELGEDAEALSQDDALRRVREESD